MQVGWSGSPNAATCAEFLQTPRFGSQRLPLVLFQGGHGNQNGLPGCWVSRINLIAKEQVAGAPNEITAHTTSTNG